MVQINLEITNKEHENEKECMVIISNDSFSGRNIRT